MNPSKNIFAALACVVFIPVADASFSQSNLPTLPAVVAADDAVTESVSCYADLRIGFNARPASADIAVANAVKFAISKKLGELRVARYGKTSSLQIKKINERGAAGLIFKNNVPFARFAVNVSGAEIVSNDGSLPKTEKNVVFGVRTPHETHKTDANGVCSENAAEFIEKNSSYYDCEGSHEIGGNGGTRRNCRDIVHTVRKIVKVDMNITFSR